ncbi:Protein pih1d3 [Dinochytrium kinnereticum]|nr:Protein pih1d3 [Dinochytrium kinnereticum]
MDADVGYRTGLQELTALFASRPDVEEELKQIVRVPGDKSGPANIAPKPAKSSKAQTTKKTSDDIWDDEEVGAFADVADARPQPEYQIKYRQKVSAEDIYLQMGNKSMSAACTDEFVVVVELPSTSFRDIVVNCSNDNLDLRTPR